MRLFLMTLQNDTSKWHFKMTPQNDTSKWHFKMTLQNDTSKWHFKMTLSKTATSLAIDSKMTQLNYTQNKNPQFNNPHHYENLHTDTEHNHSITIHSITTQHNNSQHKCFYCSANIFHILFWHHILCIFMLGVTLENVMAPFKLTWGRSKIHWIFRTNGKAT